MNHVNDLRAIIGNDTTSFYAGSVASDTIYWYAIRATDLGIRDGTLKNAKIYFGDSTNSFIFDVDANKYISKNIDINRHEIITDGDGILMEWGVFSLSKDVPNMVDAITLDSGFKGSTIIYRDYDKNKTETLTIEVEKDFDAFFADTVARGIDRFGHADLTLSSGKGDTASLSHDGWSIYYTREWSVPGGQTFMKVRVNITDLSAPPTIVYSISTNSSYTLLRYKDKEYITFGLIFASESFYGDEYCGIPLTPLVISDTWRSVKATISPGKIVTTNPEWFKNGTTPPYKQEDSAASKKNSKVVSISGRSKRLNLVAKNSKDQVTMAKRIIELHNLKTTLAITYDNRLVIVDEVTGDSYYITIILSKHRVDDLSQLPEEGTYRICGYNPEDKGAIPRYIQTSKVNVSGGHQFATTLGLSTLLEDEDMELGSLSITMDGQIREYDKNVEVNYTVSLMQDVDIGLKEEGYVNLGIILANVDRKQHHFGWLYILTSYPSFIGDKNIFSIDGENENDVIEDSTTGMKALRLRSVIPPESTVDWTIGMVSVVI